MVSAIIITCNISVGRKVLSFPLPATAQNYLELTDLKFVTLTALSVVYWCYDTSVNDESYVVGYSTSDRNAAIVIGREYGQLKVKVASGLLTIDYNELPSKYICYICD